MHFGIFKHTNECIQCFPNLIFHHRMTPFQDLEQCNKLNLGTLLLCGGDLLIHWENYKHDSKDNE
jgi:hypothetical protein